MLHKTRGIVFRFTKYGETSIIVNIFTELFGMQSYIVNGVRNKSSKSKIALYQPLTLLDLVVYHREHASINRIKEIKCLHPYQSLSTDVRKSALAMFMNEIITKTIREESHAQELCEFLIDTFITLDQQHAHTENFHLIFLLKLSRLLGFGAHTTNDVLNVRVPDLSVEKLLAEMIGAEYNTSFQITATQRRELLDLILKFYSDHVDTLGEVKSVQVLREVLH